MFAGRVIVKGAGSPYILFIVSEKLVGAPQAFLQVLTQLLLMHLQVLLASLPSLQALHLHQ
jgi:hypothetical protein